MSSQASQRRTRRHGRRRTRGAAAVEFALVAPIFVLLVFGMIDVGRAVMVQDLMTSAARDGARKAILEGSTASEVVSQVTDYLAASSVPSATVTVTPNPLNSAAIGDPVSVTVQVPFDSASWLPSSWFFKGATLEATVVMRRETASSSSSST